MANTNVTENDIRTELDKNLSSYSQKKVYNNIVKRLIDLMIAMLLMIILSPLMFIISILVKLDSSGPIFYRGIRTGRFGKEFRIFKFRSMVVNAENIGGGTTALQDPRITKAGMFLRKSKLDEIPQILNIIIGNMSFIGPRPELPIYTKKYEGIEKIILDVCPGLTDMSSLEFISLDEIVGSENADNAYEKYVLKRKNHLRVEYVLKQSVILDCKLFFRTIMDVISKIIKVMRRRGSEPRYGIQNAEKF